MANSPLSDKDKRERELARKLGFHSGSRGQRELENFRSRARSRNPNDPRYLPAGAENDYGYMKVARDAEKRHRTPIQEFIRKKHALTDDEDVKNHMSAKSFLDRYRDAILAMLQGAETDYRKRQLRREIRSLEQKYFNGDDAPLPAHIAANDKKRALRIAEQKAEQLRSEQREKAKPFMEAHKARVARAQDKQIRNIQKKRKSRRRKK